MITLDMVNVKKPLPMSAIEIKEFRREKKLTQSQLAKLLNVSIKTVQAWEQNINLLGGCALRILRILKENSKIFKKLVAQYL